MSHRNLIVFQETTMPRALTFGMKHHLGDLYQVCSKYAPGAKKRLCPVGHIFKQAYIGKYVKSSCMKSQGRRP